MINLYYAVIQASKKGASTALVSYIKSDRTFNLFKDVIHRFVYKDTPTNLPLDQVGFDAFSELEIETDAIQSEWLDYIHLIEGMSGNSLKESDICVVYLDDRLSFFILMNSSDDSDKMELHWYEYEPMTKLQGKLKRV